jgi:hypothetical protein
MHIDHIGAFSAVVQVANISWLLRTEPCKEIFNIGAGSRMGLTLDGV